MPIEHEPRAAQTPERATAELDSLARERLDTLAKTPEANTEAQTGRAEAAREAIAKHETQPQPDVTEAATPPPAPFAFSARLDRAINYTQTLQSVQRRLSPTSRSFSKVIHTPAVEAVSATLERSVMRPSVITGALWAAAIVGLVFYLVARAYGYQLSGSEMLVSLLAGGLIGGLLEAVNRAVRRRSS